MLPLKSEDDRNFSQGLRNKSLGRWVGVMQTCSAHRAVRRRNETWEYLSERKTSQNEQGSEREKGKII